MRFFNEFIEVRKTGQKLPHWEQPGATYFITWRLADSIPEELMDKWTRDEWLLENPKPWDDAQEEEYHRIFSMEIMRLLDKGYGSCVLREVNVRKIVEDSMHHADGSRYDLHAWVAMPNHVHVLFSTTGGELLEKLVGGWKKFSARRINVMIGQEGKLWQKNYFDTMIQDWDHMFRAARYVRRNPRGLREGEFTLYEAEWVRKMLG
jgi:REP element-mobilizing transposase RayT